MIWFIMGKSGKLIKKWNNPIWVLPPFLSVKMKDHYQNIPTCSLNSVFNILNYWYIYLFVAEDDWQGDPRIDGKLKIVIF